jgi:hypothetical protein
MVGRIGVTESPAIGERMEYIIESFGKKDKMSDFIVDTNLVRERGFDQFNIAKDHYHRLFVYNPMVVIMDLVYGEQVSRKALNPKSYAQIETVSAKAGNILGFFGASKFTKKRRFLGLGVDDTLLKEIRQLRITDMAVEDEGSDDEMEE